MIARDLEHLEYFFDAAAGMNTNGQISRLSFLVDWKEIRVIQRLVVFDAAKENTYGAVLLSEADLLNALFERMQRQNRCPSDSLLRLGAGIG